MVIFTKKYLFHGCSVFDCVYLLFFTSASRTQELCDLLSCKSNRCDEHDITVASILKIKMFFSELVLKIVGCKHDEICNLKKYY